MPNDTNNSETSPLSVSPCSHCGRLPVITRESQGEVEIDWGPGSVAGYWISCSCIDAPIFSETEDEAKSEWNNANSKD